MSTGLKVRNNAAASRYEIEIDGHLSVAEYRFDGSRMIFNHTMVPPELRGRGIAEKLVRAALDDARQSGRLVIPECSYVAKFIERHAEYRDLLAS